MIGPVMIDIEGLELTGQDCELLRHPLVGGLIFFARNYRDRVQLEELVAAIREVRPEILLAVDQEGGRVQRFRNEFTRLPSMQALCGRADSGQLQDVGWLLAAELLAVGLDFSFAPVLDADDHRSRVIGDRSFCADPRRLAEQVRPFMRGMREAGMATTGKHFPGHGHVIEDSHEELPEDGRPLQEIMATDAQPFIDCIEAGELDAIMPAHIRFVQVDRRPVGFSPVWLQQTLRGQLGFSGVIFSDDLSMGGAAIAGGYADRIRAALEAGCDMGVVCNCRAGVIEILEALDGYSPRRESSERLKIMRGRPVIQSWRELKSCERWHKTRDWLASWM
ncbi:beta-N-acetylhexosaminidase [Microbulbifer thermotolerans]|uniref:beta-N-acetylhexosaminidase n=1 Tax=Microbulbifer thermotolerans TaxID=252514 RepID=UPI00224ADDFE|nr:beta-N-acetylhexosaminidase [Microbulbifer thermotolerans]MCX2779792.1 beta-N-acetylhexosaminidase [Microbulbifer thermotolerans]MCX2805037.1 beta-N-acetylhexosaminidase [Microbulbifer thermotolerans]MCX2840218.1 beta-N-acetylhexosaminidase [Microbulbifer thermotolerans]